MLLFPTVGFRGGPDAIGCSHSFLLTGIKNLLGPDSILSREGLEYFLDFQPPSGSDLSNNGLVTVLRSDGESTGNPV
jgi:hypothetical protein